MRSSCHIRTMSAAVIGLVAIVALGVSSKGLADPERPGEGVSVQPAVGTWTAAVPVSWIYVELLEELGYEVENPISLEIPVAFLAISEGDIDYWPNAVLPIHEPQLPDNFRDAATIFDPFCSACGLQGFLVDIESVERYDIEGITDFVERAEVRDAFDHNDDGRAELYGCPPGWGCHEVINEMIEKFDLEDSINHVEAGYAANFAETLSHIQAGEPALYYTWAPSAWFLELKPGQDVMWINAPGIVRDEAERVEGVEGAVTDPIDLGFVTDNMMIASNDVFLEQNPAAAELFRQTRIPLEWIAKADATMSEEDLSDAEVRPLAAEWIEANRDRVDKWLDAAREAAR